MRPPESSLSSGLCCLFLMLAFLVGIHLPEQSSVVRSSGTSVQRPEVTDEEKEIDGDRLIRLIIGLHVLKG